MRTIIVAIFSSLGLWAAPNVIFIMADDLAYGDLACYGSESIRTPVLDRMAEEGLRLTSYHSGNTVCTPSRMALLTGAYPPRVGWRGGVLGHGIKTDNGLAPEALTMAEVFKAAGYRTALCGKWHIGSSDELHPLKQGFDSATFIKLSNNQTKELWRDYELIANPFDNTRLSERFTREAIDFITADSAKPFFLYLPYTAPHFPAQAHPDWKGKSRLEAYGDVVEELDARVGEILATLKARDLDANTLVVFTSDNGPEPGQKKWATAKPFRGLKWSALEGGTRVPCILRWPGKIPAGRDSDALIGAIDWLPSLAQASGITLGAASPKRDGLNIWGTVIGADSTHPRKDLLFWQGWATPQAIRVGNWKLYFDKIKELPGSRQGPVLFDLASDPSENKNLAADHPERVSEMLVQAREQLAEIAQNAIPLGGPSHKSKVPKRPQWLK